MKKTGITVIRNGSFLAVAGTDEYEVIKAVDTIKKSAVWKRLRRFNSTSIFEQLKNNKRISLKVVDGMPTEAPLAADTKINPNIKSSYSRPYVMHASIAPSAAVAKFEENQLEIWTHSQGIYLLRASLAELFHMPDDKIKIYHRSNSGCYGHNGADDAAIDAALIAKAMPGTAILLKWTRQDEHAWEPYSSAMVMELSANIDKKNKKIFVANPQNGSRNNRGCAVDLTLYELSTGSPVEMISGYDEFTDRAFPYYYGGTTKQRWLRDLLRKNMESEGFSVYEYEWWHFDYKDWEKYGIGNLKFEDIK